MNRTALDPRIRDALARRVRGERPPASRPPQVSLAPGQPVPLTATQHAIWLHVQVDEPDSPLYNLATSVRVRGRLQIDHLRAALEGVLQRQQLLRSRVVIHESEPHLVVDPALVVQPELVDLSDHGPQAEALMLDDARRLVVQPFDLTRGPLVRLRIYHLADEETALQVVAHHMVFDGWSFGVLLQELAQHYVSLNLGQNLVPPPPARQYADVAVEHRCIAASPTYQSSLDYWRTTLQDHMVGPVLPVDRPGPLRASYPAERCWFWLAETEQRALEATARSLGVSKFAVFAAALAACLHRFGGCEDLSFVVPVSLRDSIDLQQLIGPLIGTTLLRAPLQASMPFEALARRLHARAVGNLAHVGVPLETSLQFTASADMLQRPQVALYWDDTPVPDAFKVQGLMAYREALPNQRTGFPLTVIVQSNLVHGRSLVTFEFAADQFDPSSIESLSSAMRRLLTAALASPDLAVGALPMMSVEEGLAQACRGEPERLCASPRLLLSHFAAQAKRRPQAPAVRSANTSLRYAELDQAADRVAARLRAAGLRPEERVGLQVRRSVDLLVALLGVMKAGGAYLPLDVRLPAARLAFMCADAGVRLVLVDAEQPEAVPDGTLALAMPGPDAPAAPALPVSIDPQALAYVLYTSGSTGQPKAVMISHGALANLLQDFVHRLGLDESARMLASTALFFDIAGLELFAPLWVGAQVLITPSDAEGMAAAVAAWGREAAPPPVMQATPTRWAALLAQGWRPQAGQWLLCGGEALSAELAGRLQQTGAHLLNVYGPTETTIWSTAWRARPQVPVRIGQGIANTVVRILGADLEPVPPGAMGELCLGGLGLARGYLGRPALTAERFVPDPYAVGRRLYRTGDQARWNTDGELEFLGRVDSQVKVRGHRIELSEIEAAAARQSGVQTAVVVVDQDARTGARLVLHLQGLPGEALRCEDVQDALRAELPVYMWPAAVHQHEQLPLTAGGKVDRRALQLASQAAAARVRRRPYEAAQTPTEQLLAQIWATALGLPEAQIGRDDDFFDLGGHSLMAMRAVAHLDDRLGVTVSVRTLLEHHSLAELARQLDLQVWLSRSGPSDVNGLAAADNLAEGSL